MIDENNLKYLDNKNEIEQQNLPYICNTKYASGTVFFSSILDAIIAQVFFNQTLFEVLDKLIFGSTIKSETNIEENCKLNMIRIPAKFGGKITFNQFF